MLQRNILLPSTGRDFVVMPKKTIKKWLPDPHKIREHKSLQFLGDVLHDPNLWHINRHSVSKAFLVGVFCCFVPMPFQMVLAAVVAVWVNCNLPLSIALVWISNPVTIPPIFYFTYLVGAYILGRTPVEYPAQFSFDWAVESISQIGAPLFFGSFVCALFFSLTSYAVVDYLWRRKIRKDWQARAQRRALRTQATGRQ